MPKIAGFKSYSFIPERFPWPGIYSCQVSKLDQLVAFSSSYGVLQDFLFHQDSDVKETKCQREWKRIFGIIHIETSCLVMIWLRNDRQKYQMS